jgi:predicted nucleic acid-binding protein
MYAHDLSAVSKHREARTLVESLWNTGEGYLSTQVLQELYINLRRKLRRPLPLDEVRQIIRDYSTWNTVTNTAESVLEAMDIETQYKVSFWDALILQAAIRSGASALYSEDLANGQIYRGIQVVNPFIVPAQ